MPFGGSAVVQEASEKNSYDVATSAGIQEISAVAYDENLSFESWVLFALPDTHPEHTPVDK
jgi:hypothetical protein